MHWLDERAPDARERVLAEMRRIRRTADYHEAESRRLAPKFGEVGGDVPTDHARKGQALAHLLRVVGQGVEPWAAAQSTGEEVAGWVRRTNEGRGAWGRRWERTEQASLDDAARALLRAADPVVEIRPVPESGEGAAYLQARAEAEGSPSMLMQLFQAASARTGGEPYPIDPEVLAALKKESGEA